MLIDIEAEEDRWGVLPRTFPYIHAQRYRGRGGQVRGPPPGQFHTHVLRDIEAEEDRWGVLPPGRFRTHVLRDIEAEEDRSGVLPPDISIHTCSEI